MEPNIPEPLRRSIDSQFAYNRFRNIFCGEKGAVCFNRLTREWLTKRRGEAVTAVRRCGPERVARYMGGQLLRCLHEVNQYAVFTKADRKSMVEIYCRLFADIASAALDEDGIRRRHYARIQALVKRTNAFIWLDNPHNRHMAVGPVCANYAPRLQIDVLGIDLDTIKEPVLDIGCGKEGSLVAFLRGLGYDAYGIDRACGNGRFLRRTDWMEFDYKDRRWGTVVSHLSFTGHFLHNHRHRLGDYAGYARKYISILASLKPGGSWYYTPSLPFMEHILPEGLYVDSAPVYKGHKRTIVTRKPE